MSRMNPLTIIRRIRARKGQEPIVAVTAYDAITAYWADRAGVDMILVGDSVGTTHLGFSSTVPVTLDMMIHHAAAVMRSNPSALVVCDLPFGYGQAEPDRLLAASCRVMQETGVSAVKLEGGEECAPSVERLVRAGIPVLGHIGLQPQQVLALGGYRKFGVNEPEREGLVRSARALEEAGAFALVIEMVDPLAARAVTEAVGIPVIGIGADDPCDGQILVSTDLLGLNPGPVPKFVQPFAALGKETETAFARYAAAVREGRFPVAGEKMRVESSPG